MDKYNCYSCNRPKYVNSGSYVLLNPEPKLAKVKICRTCIAIMALYNFDYVQDLMDKLKAQCK